MTQPGYIYVLINPSMEGLVKIGKTQRDPEHRVGELSRPTGVPTPFQLLYKAYFSDCSQAERLIHDLLQDARLTDRREFFRLSPYRATRAVLDAERILGTADPPVETAPVQAEKPTATATDLQPEVCDELLEKAKNTIKGVGNTLQDTDRGIALLEQAANVGCLEAFRELGSMYAVEDGDVRQDLKKARVYFQKGLDRGDPSFWKDMADTYSTDHPNNWFKCWRNYFTSEAFAQPSSSLTEIRRKSFDIRMYRMRLFILRSHSLISPSDLVAGLEPLAGGLETDALLAQKEYIALHSSRTDPSEDDKTFAQFVNKALATHTSPELRSILDCAAILEKAANFWPAPSKSPLPQVFKDNPTEALRLLAQATKAHCIGSFKALGFTYLRDDNPQADRMKAAETYRTGIRLGDDMCWIGAARWHEGISLEKWGKYWLRYFETAHFREPATSYPHLDQKLASEREYLESIGSWLDQHTLPEIAKHVDSPSTSAPSSPFHQLALPILRQCQHDPIFSNSLFIMTRNAVDPIAARLSGIDLRIGELAQQLHQLLSEQMELPISSTRTAL